LSWKYLTTFFNSGGDENSAKVILALAKLCAEWPDARQELRQRSKKNTVRYGFEFSRMEWLIAVHYSLT